MEKLEDSSLIYAEYERSVFNSFWFNIIKLKKLIPYCVSLVLIYLTFTGDNSIFLFFINIFFIIVMFWVLMSCYIEEKFMKKIFFRQMIYLVLLYSFIFECTTISSFVNKIFSGTFILTIVYVNAYNFILKMIFKYKHIRVHELITNISDSKVYKVLGYNIIIYKYYKYDKFLKLYTFLYGYDIKAAINLGRRDDIYLIGKVSDYIKMCEKKTRRKKWKMDEKYFKIKNDLSQKLSSKNTLEYMPKVSKIFLDLFIIIKPLEKKLDDLGTEILRDMELTYFKDDDVKYEKRIAKVYIHYVECVVAALWIATEYNNALSGGDYNIFIKVSFMFFMTIIIIFLTNYEGGFIYKILNKTHSCGVIGMAIGIIYFSHSFFRGLNLLHLV